MASRKLLPLPVSLSRRFWTQLPIPLWLALLVMTPFLTWRAQSDTLLPTQEGPSPQPLGKEAVHGRHLLEASSLVQKEPGRTSCHPWPGSCSALRRFYLPQGGLILLGALTKPPALGLPKARSALLAGHQPSWRLKGEGRGRTATHSSRLLSFGLSLVLCSCSPALPSPRASWLINDRTPLGAEPFSPPPAPSKSIFTKSILPHNE